MSRSFEGWGEMRIDFPDQSVILKDFPEPSVIFDPPLNRRDFSFHGAAERFTKEGLVDISDCEFSLRSKNLSVFGKVTRTVLKEPDNYLTG